MSVYMRILDAHYWQFFGRWQVEYHPNGERLLFSVRVLGRPRWGHGISLGRRELRWGRLTKIRDTSG